MLPCCRLQGWRIVAVKALVVDVLCVHILADGLVKVHMQSEDQLCSYLADVLLMIMNTINDC